MFLLYLDALYVLDLIQHCLWLALNVVDFLVVLNVYLSSTNVRFHCRKKFECTACGTPYPKKRQYLQKLGSQLTEELDDMSDVNRN